MDPWSDPRVLLEAEINQRAEEGAEVEEVRAEFARLGSPPAADEVEALWRRLEALPGSAGLAAREPSDLEGIRRLRPAAPALARRALGEEELADRVLGAWLGRCAGCLTGKPVEGWTRAEIRHALEAARAYPLDGYFPFVEFPPRPWHRATEPRWFRGAVAGMVRDDDLDYTILGLHLLESKGRDFTTEDVGELWLRNLPYLLVYTAERVAYRNLVLGLRPPATATHRNPYREWIGAQIRADIFGYVCPGNPLGAADLAYRDAALSHCRNGIYGEMLGAAMVAAAFATDDPALIIASGLAAIPAECRLARAVRQVQAWWAASRDWERVLDQIEAACGAYHWVHTINNACLVVLGLLAASGDLGVGITRAVMGGWDTDCNGATAGSIIGAMRGARALPAEWTAPLGDRIDTVVASMQGAGLRALARRTTAIALGLS